MFDNSRYRSILGNTGLPRCGLWPCRKSIVCPVADSDFKSTGIRRRLGCGNHGPRPRPSASMNGRSFVVWLAIDVFDTVVLCPVSATAVQGKTCRPASSLHEGCACRPVTSMLSVEVSVVVSTMCTTTGSCTSSLKAKAPAVGFSPEM